VKKEPVWPGHVDGEGVVHLDSPRLFKAYTAGFKNHEIEIVLRKRKRQRSRSQNGYWWSVVIPMVAEACGYQRHEHEAVHDELIRVLVGLKPDSNPALQIRVSTTEMDTQDFNTLIESVQIFAAEKMGIVIPDPDPEWKVKRAKAQRAA
jgi:hypothetical protein